MFLASPFLDLSCLGSSDTSHSCFFSQTWGYTSIGFFVSTSPPTSLKCEVPLLLVLLSTLSSNGCQFTDYPQAQPHSIHFSEQQSHPTKRSAFSCRYYTQIPPTQSVCNRSQQLPYQIVSPNIPTILPEIWTSVGCPTTHPVTEDWDLDIARASPSALLLIFFLILT